MSANLLMRGHYLAVHRRMDAPNPQNWRAHTPFQASSLPKPDHVQEPQMSLNSFKTLDHYSIAHALADDTTRGPPLTNDNLRAHALQGLWHSQLRGKRHQACNNTTWGPVTVKLSPLAQPRFNESFVASPPETWGGVVVVVLLLVLVVVELVVSVEEVDVVMVLVLVTVVLVTVVLDVAVVKVVVVQVVVVTVVIVNVVIFKVVIVMVVLALVSMSVEFELAAVATPAGAAAA
eukprot:CAMPEP_0172934770 /NCGR_PEP_ID=MMETSP1075-20121228/221180_1 /TAXON_ID=2916 /ORGANISM="Ceratium fusus, Strain PA161109" /LENGTH=232 /DNA_ID=CAMNT_0013796127 /DNA_START=1710 /DNA_END=2407 /DNA_ORIENTATION=+